MNDELNNLNSVEENQYDNNVPYYANNDYANNNLENNYSDSVYSTKNKKSGFGWKLLLVIAIIALIVFILLKFFGKDLMSDDEKYSVLSSRVCDAAKTYIDDNPNMLDVTIPGKSAIIRFNTLSNANLIEAQIENPYYDGGLLNKGTMPKYYSMDNSVRLTVLNDGTIGCELVDNANDVIAPELRLEGDTEIVLPLGTEYEDPGYVATDDYDGNITDKVVISGNVNATKVGTYELTYTIQDSTGNVASKKRTIKYENYSEIALTMGSILDTVSPQISLKGSNPYCMVKGTKYVEPGAVAIDNVDGQISDRIAVTNKVTGNLIGTFRVVYAVEDSSGNEEKAYRTVIVSTECSNNDESNDAINTRPELSLIGKNSITIPIGSEYLDLGASAYDREDGDITNRIVTDTTGVNVNSAGVYKVIYRVTDSHGVTSTTTRTVTVKQNVYGNPIVSFIESKNNINVEVGTGDNTLLVSPKAVNENGAAVNVNRRIEDYLTKETVSSIDWDIAGKYRVIYTAIHANGVLKQTKSMVVTIDDSIVEITGNDTIEIQLRDEECDINIMDLNSAGIDMKYNGSVSPIVSLSGIEGKACTVGKHEVTVEASINDGPVTVRVFNINVVNDTAYADIMPINNTTVPSLDVTRTTKKQTTTKKNTTVKATKVNDENIHKVCDGKKSFKTEAEAEKMAASKCGNSYSVKYVDTCYTYTCTQAPKKVIINSNSSFPNDVYNTSGTWVGGAVTGVTLTFSTVADVDLSHFEWASNCETISGKISVNNKKAGKYTWTEEGENSICIRAVSVYGVAGEWSDPVKLYIDRTGPAVKFTHTWADGKYDWHSESSLNVQYKASDEQSGLSHFEYTYDDVKAKKASKITTYKEATGSLIVNENTEPKRSELFVFVRAVDKAGNKGEWTLNPAHVNLDTVKPNAPKLTVVGNKTAIVTIKTKFTDGKSVRPSGFGNLIYTIDDGVEQEEISEIIKLPTNKTSKNISNKVKVWAVDKAGNRSESYSTATVTIAPEKIKVEAVQIINGGKNVSKNKCNTSVLKIGTKLKLSAKITPAKADVKEVSWSISDSKIAKIDGTGQIQALNEGTAVITVKAGDVITTCNLVVTKPSTTTKKTTTKKTTTKKTAANKTTIKGNTYNTYNEAVAAAKTACKNQYAIISCGTKCYKYICTTSVTITKNTTKKITTRTASTKKTTTKSPTKITTRTSSTKKTTTKSPTKTTTKNLTTAKR